ncbi:MAG: glycosyltransferase [Pseudomonadota bacterium]
MYDEYAEYNHGAGPESQRPTIPISVALLVTEPTQRLNHCIHAISLQDLDRREFELIIVDASGKTYLRPIITPYTNKLNINVIKCYGASPTEARNTAVSEASGDTIVFTSPETMARPTWLSSIKRWTDSHPTALIAGSVVISKKHNPYACADAYIQSHVRRVAPLDHAVTTWTLTNAAFPTAVLREIGGFRSKASNQPRSEERTIADQWRKLGHPIVFADDAVVQGDDQADFKDFTKRYALAGKQNAFWRKRIASMAAQQKPVARIDRRLLQAPFENEKHLGRALKISTLLAWAQAAQLYGETTGKRRRLTPSSFDLGARAKTTAHSAKPAKFTISKK